MTNAGGKPIGQMLKYASLLPKTFGWFKICQTLAYQITKISLGGLKISHARWNVRKQKAKKNPPQMPL